MNAETTIDRWNYVLNGVCKMCRFLSLRIGAFKMSTKYYGYLQCGFMGENSNTPKTYQPVTNTLKASLETQLSLAFIFLLETIFLPSPKPF